MGDGELTGKVGEKLTKKFNPNEYVVYYDHGKNTEKVIDKIGNIYVSLCQDVTRKTQIGQLDIAIVRKEDNKAVLLVEIEESSSKPKTIIGDVFSFLLGNYVKFKKNGKEFGIKKDTTFLLLILGSNASPERVEWIKENALSMKGDMETFNSNVGKIEIQFTQEKNEEKIANIILNKVII